MRKIMMFLVVFLATNLGFAQQEVFHAGQLEKEFQQNIKKAYDASVLICNLDSNGNMVGGYFSGVVVDAKGHILTAAHAVKPNKSYLVSFPDGRVAKAKGLGVIPSVDAAMMVIADKGKWPFAEMGWSSTLEQYMPCFSIAYPGSYASKTPTVRFGHVTHLIKVNGFLRNTCLMEPGDSGGPLFDFKGRVIGTHSRINGDITNNLECSIGNFRKYWTSLKEPKIHTAFIPEDKVENKDKPGILKVVPEMKDMIVSFKAEDATFQKVVLTIKDSAGTSILGTLIDLTGLIPAEVSKGKSFLASKSSMIDAIPFVELANGKKVEAKILERDEANDLVLLQIDKEILGGIKLVEAVNVAKKQPLGTFLISPRPKSTGKFSVLGNLELAVPKSVARYLGVEPSYRTTDYQMVVIGLHPTEATSAVSAKDDIAVKDELLKMNERKLLSIKDMPEELSKYAVGDRVTLEYRREKGEETFRKSIIIEPRYVKPNRASDWFSEGRSQRRDDFKEVFVHDATLSPAECGGPVFDTQGNFYGINIARMSRTSSFAIPAPVVVQFVRAIKFN